jgi:tetratricopeptide (TPR) repeat protein
VGVGFLTSINADPARLCVLFNNMWQSHLMLLRNWAIRFAIGLLFAIPTLSAYAQGDDRKKQTRSPYTQECITEEKIVQENKWTGSDEFGRYEGNDAYLFAETVSPELMHIGPDYSFDTVIVWGGPNVWGFAVAFPFKAGCALGHWFVGEDYKRGTRAVEEYRNSGSPDFEQFLSPPKRNYYQAERYYSERRYVEAEPLYLEAIKEFKKIGQYAPSVNMTLHKIALLNDAVGKFDIAEKHYVLAIAGWHASLGPGSVQESNVRTDFVKMLRKIGREADAET